MGSSGPGRVRVERGIYRQPNGKYAVCWRHAGRLRFRTVGFDLAEARRERLALIERRQIGVRIGRDRKRVFLPAPVTHAKQAGSQEIIYVAPLRIGELRAVAWAHERTTAKVGQDHELALVARGGPRRLSNLAQEVDGFRLQLHASTVARPTARPRSKPAVREATFRWPPTRRDHACLGACTRGDGALFASRSPRGAASSQPASWARPSRPRFRFRVKHNSAAPLNREPPTPALRSRRRRRPRTVSERAPAGERRSERRELAGRWPAKTTTPEPAPPGSLRHALGRVRCTRRGRRRSRQAGRRPAGMSAPCRAPRRPARRNQR
jgi:hypothetical protein